MGRRARGWRLWRDPKTTIFHARWSHDGEDFSVTTGTRDPGEAAREAAKVYGAWAAGQWKPTRRVGVRPAPLVDLVAEWLADYEAGRPRGGAKGLYESHAGNHFIPFFKNDALELTGERIADYQTERLRVVLRQTVQREMTSLASLLRWLVKKGHLPAMPEIPKLALGQTGVRDPKRGKRHEADLAPEQVEQLLAALPETSKAKRADAETIRVRDYYVVLYETSLRPSTVEAISVPEHWRPGRKTLTVTADVDKARFGRSLPLTERALEALERSAPKAGPIFGHHNRRKPLEAARKRLGLPRVSAYDFRHARGTHWVEEGGSLAGVAYLMGHKRVTTTNRYVKPSERAGRAVLAKAKKGRGGGDEGGGGKVE